jgi:hypothetical protein
MARWLVIVACVAGVALLAPRPLTAQGPGPKQVFTDALARFSLALDGAYGDEGPAAAESLSQMERVRQQWDALIRNYETGMAAEVGGAPADVAARMRWRLRANISSATGSARPARARRRHRARPQAAGH